MHCSTLVYLLKSLNQLYCFVNLWHGKSTKPSYLLHLYPRTVAVYYTHPMHDYRYMMAKVIIRVLINNYDISLLRILINHFSTKHSQSSFYWKMNKFFLVGQRNIKNWLVGQLNIQNVTAVVSTVMITDICLSGHRMLNNSYWNFGQNPE